MRIGIVVEETWSFFQEIYDDLAHRHRTDVFSHREVKLPFFEQRVNQSLFQRDLSRFLAAHQVVFFEWASELLVHASRLPKQSGIVARLHRYELYQWADQVNWQTVDKIILVSQAKKREFATRFQEHAHKVVVIPEAISFERFQPVLHTFSGNIGILCHLTPRKRVYELILAFYELGKLYPGLTLHIGGGEHPRFKDYYTALQKLVQDLHLQDHVVFYGNITQPEKWYGKVELFISNSYSEGLQVAPMEAIASGCYCLSHHWDGADELLPGESLYYTERELITKIAKYIDANQSDRDVLAAGQMEMVRQQFNMRQVKQHVRAVIEAVGASWAEGEIQSR